MIHDNYEKDGMPAGGFVRGEGMAIDWQDGPISQYNSRNGAFVEEVIEASILRIEYYQHSKFHCLENAVALGHLYAALEALHERTRERTDRGVEGSHQK